jgi:hypothetical protein
MVFWDPVGTLNPSAMSLTPADPRKSSFADLPPEIRNEIYSHVAAQYPYSITFSGLGRRKSPLLDVHPLIDREFDSLFFSMPRTYEFRDCLSRLSRRKHSLAFCMFFDSLAFKYILRTRRSKVELELKNEVLHRGAAVARAKEMKAVGYEYAKKEYARLRAGGTMESGEAAAALKELNREMDSLYETDHVLEILGKLVCIALPNVVADWPAEHYLDIAVVFKEYDIHGVTFQGTAEPVMQGNGKLEWGL